MTDERPDLDKDEEALRAAQRAVLRPVFDLGPIEQVEPKKFVPYGFPLVEQDLVNARIRMTGPALRDEAIRACALAAAAELTAPNSRPNEQDLNIWHNNVITMAERFVTYIRDGLPKGDA